MKLVSLKTDNRLNPLVIHKEQPNFSWNVESEESNIYQQSYRIRVWHEDGQLVWDSKVVKSNKMIQIPYDGVKLESGTRYNWSASGTFRYGSSNDTDEWLIADGVSAESYFETGYFHDEDWKGCYIGEVEDQVYHLYRKSFSCGKKIRKAKLFICGLGHFEFFINGLRVSDYVLEPGWSDYNKTCFYTAYDITSYIKEGNNAALVKLGDGMYNVPGGRYVYYERSYGKSKFIAQLVIDYEDNSRELVVTDNSWKMTEGPIKFCCIYGGEDFDGRLWREKYLLPDYIEEDIWKPVVAATPPAGKLKAMPMESMKVMQRLNPISVSNTKPGVWLYDLGTNFSGWAKILIHTNGNMEGAKIIMTPGEILDSTGRPDQSVTGKGYQWSYICNEQELQEFSPDFTYTGFRYVEITGGVPENEKDSEPNVPVIAGLVGEFIYPELELAGDFQCSNKLFNGIHKIIVQAMLSNIKSYMTDCPHREKLGWLEQTHLIGPSIMYNFDVHCLYDKIEGDMKDAQRENGLVPDICPEYVTGFGKWHEGFVDSPEWGSACIINPWYVYRNYGDKSLLSKYYEIMKKYLNYLGSRTHHEILHHGLGDWLDIGPCTPHSQNTPVPVTATCIYYYDLSIMSQIAQLLDKKEDFLDYEERMKRVYYEYNMQFLDKETGRYATGSQAAQAMSLIVGIVPPEMEEKVVTQLRNDIRKRKFAITAGDVGHPFLIAAMKKYDMADILYEMTSITETPGYGYQVVNGATTLTEEWDGPEPGKPHGSQNHFMLGSIEEWFYGSLGGLEIVRNDLPFGEIEINPTILKELDFVNTWIKHPLGKIELNWHREGEEVMVSVTIPPNVTAHLKTGDGSKQTVGSGHYNYIYNN